MYLCPDLPSLKSKQNSENLKPESGRAVTLVLCVSFQNNIATQVFQIVVTVYSEEAIPAGMEFLRAGSSVGLHSWMRLLWKDSQERPVPRGLVF